MARLISMPSFLTRKQSKLVTAAVAGTLTVATVATAAALTLPSAAAATSSGTADAHLMAVTSSQVATRAAHGDSMTSAQRIIGFDRVRFSLGKRQHEHDVMVAKAKAARAAAARAAAARAAAARAAAARAAAARAAARKAAASKAAARAAARMTAGTPSGSPEQIAQAMLAGYGWSGSQYQYLYQLWSHESGWNPYASNAGSGAYGIPQALPGSQMASVGSDWRTNPATQIKWGLNYIQGRYGSPAGAWAHEQATNWY